MNEARIGRSLRVVRRARGLRQVDVAAASHVSQALVSSIERGFCGTVALATLERVMRAAGADLECSVRYRGGAIDRLLDERHAETAMATLANLRPARWITATEVSFNHYGDRGSIDILALHAATRTALVVEVKSEIASAEEMLRRLDVKTRLAGSLVLERFGERPLRVVRLLAVRQSTANRTRVARLEPLLASAFPLRSTELRRWLAAPGPAAGGLLFVTPVRDSSPGVGARQSRRIRAPRAGSQRPAEHGTPGAGAPGDVSRPHVATWERRD